MDTYKSPPLRDATNGMGNGRVTSPENVEGETPSMKQLGNCCICSVANTATPARHLPNTKTYPSKFIQSLSGNQATAASKSPAAEERRDSQAIDPLSHVCGKMLRALRVDCAEILCRPSSTERIPQIYCLQKCAQAPLKKITAKARLAHLSQQLRPLWSQSLYDMKAQVRAQKTRGKCGTPLSASAHGLPYLWLTAAELKIIQC